VILELEHTIPKVGQYIDVPPNLFARIMVFLFNPI
jgi:hypothetical protein